MEKKRRIKLIALDMDGTLLNEQGVLSEENQGALTEAMGRGIHVVIATGRVFSALPQDVVGVRGIEYAITSNGANIVRLKDKKTIYQDLIGGEAIEPIMDILSDPSIMKEVFYDHEVYAERRCLKNLEKFGIVSERSKKYTLSTRTPVESTLTLILENRGRLENINLIFKDQQKRREVWERLEALPKVTICSSMAYNLEIGGANTSKATALSVLASRLGIEQGEIMACGDSTNDKKMLEYAGLSVAMGNAEESVKEMADFVTKSNGENGVAYAVKKFTLQG